jgi:hypothetical protein
MEPNATTMTTPAQPARRLRALACLRPPGQNLRLISVREGDAGRPELEDYVRTAFQAKHGAAIRSFMPTLLSFRDRHDLLRGVVGLREAQRGPLFLEQYLDRPVEQAIAEAVAHRSSPVGPRSAAIQRHDIVEVGNLAGASCRSAARMMAQLPAHLMAERYSWIVFTATAALRQILESLGSPLIELARADGASVAGARDEWGRYYETDPRVLAGFLPDANHLAAFAHRGGHH